MWRLSLLNSVRQKVMNTKIRIIEVCTLLIRFEEVNRLFQLLEIHFLPYLEMQSVIQGK